MSFAGRKQCRCPRWSYGFDQRPLRDWVIVQRNENRSSFNGSEWHYQEGYGYSRRAESAWSHVLCLTCGAHWRTKANYVQRLPDLAEDKRKLCYGKLCPGQAADRQLLETISSPISREKKSSPSAHKPARRSTGYVSAGKNVARRPRRGKR